MSKPIPFRETQPGSPTLRSRLGLVGLGFLLGLILVEIVLRLWANPFGFRVKGDEIILPVHAQYIVHNGENSRLDPLIVHTKNSLGFRGPEPPATLAGYLSIITIGGSTTEELYTSDGFTWTELLAERLARNFPDLWVNNAGFAGHSTYGHQILLDDVINRIRPDIVIYLVGANDLGRMEIGPFDQAVLVDPDTWGGLVRWTALHSEVAALFYNFTRAMQARQARFVGGNLDLISLPQRPLSPDEIEAGLTGFRGEPLESYRARLTQLVVSTRVGGIEPVLLTQPALYGGAVDPTTGVDLSLVEFHGKHSAMEWAVLELYNDVTRQVAETEGVFLIDLAAAIPKDSQYYWDMIHYTKSGSALVAQVVYPPLCAFLSAGFSPPAVPCEEIQ